jgi:hypothetical protein
MAETQFGLIPDESVGGRIGLSEHDSPPPSFVEALGASFRRENTVPNAFNALKKREAFMDEIDPEFDPFENIEGYEAEAEEGLFNEAFNAKAHDAIKARIDKERADDEISAAYGGWSTGLDIFASIADPVSLIPGGALVRAGRVGFSRVKSMASVSAYAGAGAGVQESVLQASQETRDAGTTIATISGSVILGGILGAAGAKYFTKAEWASVSKRIEEDLSGEVADPVEVASAIVNRAQSLSAAAVDEIDLSDLGIGGNRAAEALVNATSAMRLNPGVRTMLSPSKEVRLVYGQLVDNPVYTKFNMDGKTLGPAAENLVKEYQRGALGSWLKSSRNLYKDARKAGFVGKQADFMTAVARAGRRGDVAEDGNEFVTQAAKEAREKIFDPLLKQAKEAGLLPEDVEVTTAISYVTRMWNRQMLIGEEPEFRRIASKWIDGELSKLDPSDLSELQPAPTPSAPKDFDDEVMLEALGQVRRGGPKMAARPMLNLLRRRGGVRVGSPLAQELALRDITPKTAPGLFRKDSGLTSADNIVADDYDFLRGNVEVDQNGYALPDEIYRAIEEEAAGSRMLPGDIALELDELDNMSRAVDEWAEAKGIDLNAKMSDLRRDLGSRIDEPIPRGYDDFIFEHAEMLEAQKAKARAKSKIPDFLDGEDRQDYINDVVTEIFNNLTGRGAGDVPEWTVPITRGPLKERTFSIPDEFVEKFLENDMEAVMRKYTRTMAAEVELARKFGRADMRDQIQRINAEYEDMSQKAKTPKEREKLEKRRAEDVKNLEAFRDLVRGTYRQADENTVWSRISRAALTWNYIRLLGGVTLSSIPDAARPIAVHGLRATMREALPALVYQTRAVKISRSDARELGAVTESVLQSRLATLSDLQDPYAHGSAYERFLSSVSNWFSKATGLSWWNDTMKTISSVMTQNRMAKTALNWDGASKEDRAYLAYLGINENMAGRIGNQIRKHGVNEGGIWGANVSQWDDPFLARLWAAALNKDVDRTIVTKGVADQPLWTRTNTGKLITQFKTFGMASHQRTLIAGLQESPQRLAESMVFASALGMLVSYLKFVERGDIDEAERLLDNPGLWISNGLDRSGILTIPFEISNTMEKLGSPVGITKGAQALAGDEDRGGDVSRYASRNKTGAVLGPSAGLFEDLITIADQLANGDLKKSGANAIIRQVPGGTLPGARSALHYGLKPWLQDAVD